MLYKFSKERSSLDKTKKRQDGLYKMKIKEAQSKKHNISLIGVPKRREKVRGSHQRIMEENLPRCRTSF